MFRSIGSSIRKRLGWETIDNDPHRIRRFEAQLLNEENYDDLNGSNTPLTKAIDKAIDVVSVGAIRITAGKGESSTTVSLSYLLQISNLPKSQLEELVNDEEKATQDERDAVALADKKAAANVANMFLQSSTRFLCFQGYRKFEFEIKNLSNVTTTMKIDNSIYVYGGKTSIGNYVSHAIIGDMMPFAIALLVNYGTLKQNPDFVNDMLDRRDNQSPFDPFIVSATGSSYATQIALYQMSKKPFGGWPEVGEVGLRMIVGAGARVLANALFVAWCQKNDYEPVLMEITFVETTCANVLSDTIVGLAKLAYYGADRMGLFARCKKGGAQQNSLSVNYSTPAGRISGVAELGNSEENELSTTENRMGFGRGQRL